VAGAVIPLALGAGLAVLAGVPALAAPAPVVTSVTPAADTTGSQVVVSGSSLTLPPGNLPSEILFGGVQAKVNSCAPKGSAASSCNVTVPPQCPGHKRVDVRVITGNLESAISSGDGFTYTDAGTGPSPAACPSPTSAATATATGTATPGGSASPGATPPPAASSPATATPVAAGSGGTFPSGGVQAGGGGAASGPGGSTALMDAGGVLFVLGLAAGLVSVAAIRRRRRSEARLTANK
jgi:hypothetical protein